MTVQSAVDPICDGGPVRLEWSWTSCKEQKAVRFRGDCCFSDRSISVGLDSRHPLTRCTLVLSALITPQPVSL